MNTHSRCRVLFVIGTMGGGGAERQVVEILKRLDRSRFEPLLYLAVKQGELLGDVPSDVPVFAFWDGSKESWMRRFLCSIKLTRLLRYIHLAQVLHQQKIEVVYDRTYLATLDAAGGCFLRPTPRISCCVVDPAPELKLYVRFSVTLSWQFARSAYRSASIVLANSEGLRNRLIEYFRLNADHVQVFYNLLTPVRTVETESEKLVSPLLAIPGKCDPDPVVVSNPPANQPFLIVTAGRLHPQKGYRFLLEAIDELVHRRGRLLKLVIYGKGETESELREFVRTHSLESHVTIAGFVPDPRRCYREANLFVLPSLYEGMPNSLIEAVASGIPALATDCPSGPAEILDGGRFGRLIPPGDALALVTGIEDAMDHESEWRTRAELARRRVEQLFDPEKGIRRLETLIEQTAGRHSAQDE